MVRQFAEHTSTSHSVNVLGAYCLQVAESQVAGHGVFARCYIPQGTVVGAYPGLPRKGRAMLAKAYSAPQCKQYVFQLSPKLWLDPTDDSGLPSTRLTAFLPFLRTDVSLAFVNEPPVGEDVNVEFSYDSGSTAAEVCFVTTQNIEAGQELFIDYGSVYNRNSYKL